MRDPFLKLSAIIGSFLAAAVGALSSCVWFGWYLAVTFLLFNGHNNEVGGAVRIESFKQFIRFKLEKDKLTGYVIAVDDVSKVGAPDGNGNLNDGRCLSPKIIDVFSIECGT